MKQLLYIISLLACLQIFTIQTMPPDAPPLPDEESIEAPLPEALPDIEEEVPPAVDLEALPDVEEEASPTTDLEAPPDVEEEAPSTTDLEALPDIEEEAPPTTDLEAPPDVEEEVPVETESDIIPISEAEDTVLPDSTSALSQLQTTLKKYDNELTQLRLNIEEIATLEKALLEILQVADHRRNDTASSVVEMGKLKRKILTATKKDAETYLSKTIELFGGISKTKEYLADLENSFNSQQEKIKEQMKLVKDNSTKLQSQAASLEEKVRTIGKAEAAEAMKDEKTTAKKLQEELLTTKKEDKPAKEKTETDVQKKDLELSWHEKMLTTIYKIYESIRNTLGLATKEESTVESSDISKPGTVIEQIDQRIKELEGQKKLAQQIRQEWEKSKKALLVKLHNAKIKITGAKDDVQLREETVGQLLKRIWIITFALCKKSGIAINDFVHGIFSKAEIKKQTAEMAKPENKIDIKKTEIDTKELDTVEPPPAI